MSNLQILLALTQLHPGNDMGGVQSVKGTAVARPCMQCTNRLRKDMELQDNGMQ